MNKQDQINMLQFRIERIESHLAEQHKGNNFNLSEKPNSYDHLLPEGYEFCAEGEAEKWVKVEMLPERRFNLHKVGHVMNRISELAESYMNTHYRPIRPIQYHVALHEAVTVADEPIKVAEYYQPLFDMLHKEHNVIATQSELDEIIRTAWGLDKPQHECKYCGVMTSQPDDQCYKNPYAVDWSKAPEWADSHAFDRSGKGWFYGLKFNDMFWYSSVFDVSGFTLPTGLDWKQSKTSRP